jgi:BTB/POZ domain-containing protein KCTD9
MTAREKIKSYLDEVFKPYENSKIVQELKEELLTDLVEKYDDLINDGYGQENSYQKTVNSIGDISEIIESISDKTNELHQRINVHANQTVWDLSKSNMINSKLNSSDLRSGIFNYSDFKNSDFSDSDLSGSSFKSSDLKNVNFKKSNLSNTIFKSSDLENCNFSYANLEGSKIIKSSLRRAKFEKALINNTEFKYSELSGVSFENMKLTGTVFDYSGLRGTSFKNAVLENVSFRTNVKRTIFDGAVMDKVTYALLKGYKADLTTVKII